MVFSGYSGFFHQYNWPPQYSWNIVESGVKHNEANQPANQNNYVTTNLYFREDESAATQIYLPASNPFYLLRYTSTCQSVHYMFVSEENIEWDCQDGGLNSEMGVVHPFQDGSENNIKLHFCYYYT